MLLSPGPALRVPLAELKLATTAAFRGTTILEAAERSHIPNVLKQTRWIVGGPLGAVARLGMKRTMPQSRIKKLVIGAPRVRRYFGICQ